MRRARASSLQLVSESADCLRFAFRHGVGWVILAVACLLAALAVWVVEDLLFRVPVAFVGGVFLIVGILVVLWRCELILDLRSRTHGGRRGFWPRTKSFSGSLDEIIGVELTRTWSSTGDSGDVVLWELRLLFQDWELSDTIFQTNTEEDAYEKLERYSRKLRVPAVDRTGTAEVRRTWQDLDRTAAEDAARRGELPERLPPPPGSHIDLEWRSGRVTIVLRAAGLGVWGFLFLAMGSLPVAFAGIALLAAAGIVNVPVRGSMAGVLLGALVSLLLGLVFVVPVALAAWSRHAIRDEGGSIRVYLRFLGKEILPQLLPKHEIEEVSIRESTTRRGNRAPPPQELMVRSDQDVVRLGAELAPANLIWLRQAILYLIAH